MGLGTFSAIWGVVCSNKTRKLVTFGFKDIVMPNQHVGKAGRVGIKGAIYQVDMKRPQRRTPYSILRTKNEFTMTRTVCDLSSTTTTASNSPPSARYFI